VRAAVVALRKDGHVVEVRVTQELIDAARLTVKTVAEAQCTSFEGVPRTSICIRLQMFAI